jgi:CheY-like chemotaxis protein
VRARTILYVEDEPSDVLLLEACFRQAAVELTLRVAKDGQEAVDYLSGEGDCVDRRQHPFPTLVLLDLNLPRKSGHEVLEWIRREPAFHTLPVIVFSASNRELDVHKAYALGANAYLVKPSGYAKLLELTKALEAFWLQHNQPPPDCQQFKGV